MHYDLTIRTLFHGLPVRRLEILTGQRAVELLTVELPSVRRRQPDLVLRLEDGQIYHLELQSAGDPAMPRRMLEYYSLTGQLYQAPVRQQVLYLLALLCRGDDETEAVRAVLSKIAALDHNQRTDALERLQVLCGLRPLKGVLQRAVKRMPITLNLRENPFFQEAFAEGEQKGRAEDLQQGRVEGEHRLLSKQLERRYRPPARGGGGTPARGRRHDPRALGDAAPLRPVARRGARRRVASRSHAHRARSPERDGVGA